LKYLTRKTTRCLLSSSENINFINGELKNNPDHSKKSLAKTVCYELNLVDWKNNIRLTSCVVELENLDKMGKISLPESRGTGPKQNFSGMIRLGKTLPEPIDLADRVDNLPDLQIIRVGANDVELRIIWNELIISEHPQGKRHLVGRQVKYLIKSGDFWLGAIGFSSCALRLEARDNWIGWNDEERICYQDRVVNMSRFLIRNSVKCFNLASRVMSLTLKRFADDFEKMYGFRPWLVESFIDRSHFYGGCYKASNWQFIGHTKGRGRNDRHTRKTESVKDIYLYELSPEFHNLSGFSGESQTEEFKAIDLKRGIGNAEWSEHEFGKADLGDKRLTERLVKIASDKGAAPSHSYSMAVNGDRYAIKGYYNFIGNSNDEMTDDEILKPHGERTVQRMMGSETVYAIQDTSDLNYSTLKGCDDLGIIAKTKNSKGTLGLSLHSLFMVNDQGIPLGIGHSECYAPELVSNSKNRNSLPIEDKESYRWLKCYRKTIEISKRCPQTKVVSVMDREADIYEIFQDAYKNDNCVPVVIRAQHNRCLADSEEKLFEKLANSNQTFNAEIEIPPQRSREGKGKKTPRPALPARTADLTISYEEVTIKPPATCLKKEWEPVTLYAVYARENNPPMGAEPIKWFLLTTLKVLSGKDALECVRIYRLRWRIEEFHRVLKSGCKVEKHMQRTAEKLKLLIAVDMVIAWRIMLLSLLGREHPEISCDLVFSKCEWQTLALVSKKNF